MSKTVLADYIIIQPLPAAGRPSGLFGLTVVTTGFTGGYSLFNPFGILQKETDILFLISSK